MLFTWPMGYIKTELRKTLGSSYLPKVEFVYRKLVSDVCLKMLTVAEWSVYTTVGMEVLSIK